MTPLQEQVIGYLHAHPRSSVTEMSETLCRNKNSLKRTIADLTEMDLLDRELGRWGTGIYSLNVEGRMIALRLARQAPELGQIVPSAKVNKFVGKYIETQGYQRNNAHKDIGRVGVPC
jgi:DNA-binding MarR family transcriptional regulator